MMMIIRIINLIIIAEPSVEAYFGDTECFCFLPVCYAITAAERILLVFVRYFDEDLAA